jgi:hypothetical protein
MIHELKARMALPTPAFWRKIQKRTAATSAGFTTLTVSLAALSDHMPSKLAFLTTAAGFAAAFFGGIAAVCSLAVDDPSALPEAPATSPTPNAQGATTQE